MGLLDRAKLLRKEDLKIEKVDLGNDEFIFVRMMTGRERDRFEQSLIKEVKNAKGRVTDYERAIEDFRAKLAVCTVCDEGGKLVLTPDDYPALSVNMSAKRLEAIINKAQELNKISEEDKDNLVKNSEGGQTDVSTSDSVEN